VFSVAGHKKIGSKIAAGYRSAFVVSPADQSLSAYFLVFG
jgi:hypothetical protein